MKKLWSLALALLLSCLLLPGQVRAAEVLSSGDCGENLAWTLTDDGTLTISGNGEMQEYSPKFVDWNTGVGSDAPWFSRRDRIRAVVIQPGVSTVGMYAFYGCNAVERVSLPDTLRQIGIFAFFECAELTEITLPQSLQVIGESAFSQCSGLKDITIPDSVTTIGGRAFDCCSGLTSVVVPDSVTEFGYHVFASCTGLTSVSLPDHLTFIQGFTGCTSLKQIDFPASVTEIRDGAFSGCTSLTSVVIPAGVTKIEYNAFDGCTGLTDITIPEGVTSIGDRAFAECASLETIVLPDSVEMLGKDMFLDCTALQYVTLPNGMDRVKNGMFTGCTALATLTLPEGITVIEQFAFADSGLTHITLPQGTTTIGNWAFQECSSLTGIDIPDSVTAIGFECFSGCAGLREITIPEGVTLIYYGTFDGCASLTSVTLPNSLVTIEDGDVFATPFGNCTSLTAITFPENVDYIGNGAFAGCSALGEITFTGTAPVINQYTFDGVTATCRYPANDPSWTGDKLQNYGGTLTWVPYEKTHTHSYTSQVTAPTCTEGGFTTHTCGCGESYTDHETDPLGHSEVTDTAVGATCEKTGLTEGKHCSVCGTVTVKQEVIPALGHSFTGGKCAACGAADPDWVAPTEPAEPEPTIPEETAPVIDRLAGDHRYATAFLAADRMKEELGMERFDAVVVACGTNFADALSGSYLAAVKDAPVLLACNVDWVNDLVKDYIRTSLNSGGTVYILGGTGAVPASFEDGLEGFTVKRLAGDNRFLTNLDVLKEAGVGEQPILVCTGLGFADSLSASASKLPILLVYGNKLTEEQTEFMEVNKGRPMYIIGGDGAVSLKLESALAAYGEVTRLAGGNRFETSVLIAKTFFEKPESAVLAYAWDFPDGLCGGPLATARNAPLILTMANYETQAAGYIKDNAISKATILGGEKLIPESSVNTIFN